MKMSALYINLYIKIALHLKTKKKIILIVEKETVNNMQNAVCFESLCF